jgi:Kef-type K+ transport system membrane component KefB
LPVLYSLLPQGVIENLPLLSSSSEGASGGEPSHGVGITLLWMAVILVAAKISSLVERFGQPSVLGELVMGVILGNLTLIGLEVFEPIKQDEFISFLAQLGVIILLFQVGLETNINEMRKVGVRALLVAIIGVVAPFVLGTYLIGPWLMPGLSSNAYLFIGAALTATSVGITARVFRDLGRLQDREAQIILGAAVIDDVLGLIILAVVSAIVTVGAVSGLTVGWIILKAVLFLGAAIFIGQMLAVQLSKWFSRIQSGVGMKFTLAISIGLLLAYIAELIGLAPIVGAFAAGLILDPIQFRHFFEDPEIVEDIQESLDQANADPNVKEHVMKVMNHHANRHVEEIIEPISLFLVPIFFIKTGMDVQLQTLFNLPILAVAFGITVVAIIGKVISGFAAGDVKKSIVGWGMVPRGEVGLIFAATGRALGVVNAKVYSVIVIMVIISTLLPPPILTALLRKSEGTSAVAAEH